MLIYLQQLLPVNPYHSFFKYKSYLLFPLSRILYLLFNLFSVIRLSKHLLSCSFKYGHFHPKGKNQETLFKSFFSFLRAQLMPFSPSEFWNFFKYSLFLHKFSTSLWVNITSFQFTGSPGAIPEASVSPENIRAENSQGLPQRY